MNYLGHLLAGVAGALIYYAYVRFNPNASIKTPNPLPFRAYIVADAKVFLWGLACSAAAYGLWFALNRWGVAFTVPAAVPLFAGKVVAVPPVSWLVAFLLGLSGRVLGKIAPRVFDTLGAILRRVFPATLPPTKPSGEA